MMQQAEGPAPNGPGEGETTRERAENNGTGETAEMKAVRCYSEYGSQGEKDFCPFKDLNLPTSYEEVISRFRKLQGERAVEVFN